MGVRGGELTRATASVHKVARRTLRRSACDGASSPGTREHLSAPTISLCSLSSSHNHQCNACAHMGAPWDSAAPHDYARTTSFTSRATSRASALLAPSSWLRSKPPP
eukprot:1583940-Prymnesium_polylepis.1